MTNVSTPNIEIISAGAGSGKTYSLTERLVAKLAEGVRPNALIATTFTQKAAAELQERVRTRLLESGLPEAAAELENALIGTVHSIGIRLLQRFAFEIGVSPIVEIIAEGDEQRLFNESLSQVLSTERIESLNLLADRLGFTKKTAGDPHDWRKEIRSLTDVARVNNFSSDILQTSKQRSWESLKSLLPEPDQTTLPERNSRLLSLIDHTVSALENHSADETKTTRETAAELTQLAQQLKWRGELYWYEWARIAKMSPAKKSEHLYESLRQFAASHDECPAFHQDIRNYIELLFDIAIDALEEYQSFKKKRGLIDYTDMETYVSRLLRNDRVCQVLSAELDLLLVDEFQDTSPIQLDIFLRLSRIVRHAIWVGDPKQSIYGFRGAEPALMQAVIRAAGGIKPENILGRSWRSRPGLVYAANALFTRAFDQMPPEQVALQPVFQEPPGDAKPPLHHWQFVYEANENNTPGKGWTDQALAFQVRQILSDAWPIWNKKRDQQRPVRPGDIAILCRSNHKCAEMAEALARQGIRAAIARTGLLETPEARLAIACLKFLLTPSDLLSMSEILLISGQCRLEQLVNERIDALNANTGLAFWAEKYPLIRNLLRLRPKTMDLSAAETLELILHEIPLREFTATLGHTDLRLDNLEQLRRYAADYESACQRLHAAATLSGFLLWLSKLAESDKDEQAAGETDEAVRVMTYHKSKGLEFPVCICHDLDSGLRESIWGPVLVNENPEPDLDDVLGNRWIRLWINPYADQYRKTRFEERLHQSEAWTEARQRALDEEARLLYVGITRARDHLALPANVKSGAKWLNRVCSHGDESATVLIPGETELPFTADGRPVPYQYERILLPEEIPAAAPPQEEIVFYEPPARHTQEKTEKIPPYWIDPGAEPPPDGSSAAAGTPSHFGRQVPEEADAHFAAFRAFVMADDPVLPDAERRAAAEHLAKASMQDDPAWSSLLLEQSAACWTMLSEKTRFTDRQIAYPLNLKTGQREVELTADGLLQTGTHTWAVVFSARPANSALKYANWLLFALRKAFPDKQSAVWVVSILSGEAFEVR